MNKFDIKTTDKETLRKWFHLMTLGRAIDEKAPAYLLQSLGWSYHAPYAGHDGIQLAMGQVFRKNMDFMFPYYRDMLTFYLPALPPRRFPERFIQSDRPGMRKTYVHPLCQTGMHIKYLRPRYHICMPWGARQWCITVTKEWLLLPTVRLLPPKVCIELLPCQQEQLPVIFVIQDNVLVFRSKNDQTANRRWANFTDSRSEDNLLQRKDVFDQ